MGLTASAMLRVRCTFALVVRLWCDDSGATPHGNGKFVPLASTLLHAYHAH